MKKRSMVESVEEEQDSDLESDDSLVSEDLNDSIEESMDETDEEVSDVESELNTEKIVPNGVKKGKKRSLEDDNDDGIEKAKKKKNKKGNDLYKQPTAEELNQLRETENLFHSNLFRLQIEEILSEVKIKEKHNKQFDTWFLQLKKNIESLQETEDHELSDEKSLKKIGVKVPKITVPVNEKGNYRFLKPSNISVIGSHSLGTAIGPNITVDIMVEMPNKLFQKNDHQNYRYLRKRAIYLSYIASNLDENIVAEKKFIGESWSLKLKLVPKGSLSKHIVVYLHLAAQEGSFKLNRFLPEKNSVRPNWLLNKNDDNELIPTPLYNSIILRDLTMLESNNTASKMLKEYPNLRDGVILLKIWLKQRQPQNSCPEFNGHILTMFVLYLLYEKKLNTYMSSYQVVRNVWNILAQGDWSKVGITLALDEESKNRAAEYHKFYDCVFLGTSGYHNLVANLSKNNYQWIKSEAELAINCLDNASIDSFQVLFMRRLPFYSTFDHFICLHDEGAMKKLASEKVSDKKKIDLGVDERAQVVNLLIDILKAGLGKRAAQIFVQPEQQKEWEVTEDNSSKFDPIFIGIQLNPDFAFDIIDKGPPANQPEATKFRNFWGNKSELRRFQDGNVCEAVVWQKAQTLSEKRMICKQIVTFLFKSKFDISKNQYLYAGDQIDEFLQMKKTSLTNFAYGTGEEATLQVLKVFDDLEKQLTGLKDMPLSITGVQGSSSVFRYTDVFPPLATAYKSDKINKEDFCQLISTERSEAPKFAPAIEATIQLSTSGKWPDELEAVRKTKAAFHIQIAECLRKVHSLKAKAYENCVIVFKDGFVFRLIVAHQKEIAMLKQEIGADGIIKYRDNEESIELENRLFHLPKLNGALHGLRSQQPSFGTTCCLVKRWLSAHLLDDSHLPEIVVELLIAFMYLSPDPYRPAQIPQVGFLRFLEFFARDQWCTDPVIINFNNELTREEVIAVENHFGTARESLPELFISTPYDKLKSIWTKKAPSKVILNRVGSLAKGVLNLVEVELMKSSVLIWKPMFKPPMSGYDVLIHIKNEFNPRRFQYFDLDDSVAKNTWHPYKRHTEERIPVIEFDPVQCYLRDLRNGYGEFALFFHDKYGGNVVGVLLKPTATEKKDFKVSNVNCRRLDTSGKLVLNISAMIEDFSILGRGLVNTIDVQSKKILLD